MWLLNTDPTSRVPELKQYVDQDLEDAELGDQYGYAILSHRWEKAEEEISFPEVLSGNVSHNKKGWFKIDQSRKRAHGEGLKFLWVDTCCIDKSSSAELQEAINSMYLFYERARICLVYLRDVEAKSFDSSFSASDWFSRGWTLQELIAPKNVWFFDSQWNYLGDKSSLASEIHGATGIPVDILTGSYDPRQYPIAQRMSWAAKRKTSRIEDRAYSLMGLFNVNMPMLYGERRKAFVRLQEEIIKATDDMSIFVWSGVKIEEPGLLASSPDVFQDCGDVAEAKRLSTKRTPSAMSNRGLSIHMDLLLWSADTYLAMTRCYRHSGVLSLSEIGIFLRRLNDEDQYARVTFDGEDLISPKFFARNDLDFRCDAAVNVRQTSFSADELRLNPREAIFGVRIRCPFADMVTNGEIIHTGGQWDPNNQIIYVPPGSCNGRSIGTLDMKKLQRRVQKIEFGFDIESNPVVTLTAINASKGGQFQPEQDDWDEFIHPVYEPQVVRFDKLPPEDTRGDIWRLKCDRIQGLRVCLMDFNDFDFGDREEKKSPPYEKYPQLQMSRGSIDGALIWDFEIDHLP